MTTSESVVQSVGVTRVTDRRRARRARLDGPALIDAASSWQAGRCCNVSTSGLAVETEQDLALGSTVEVYFELPSGVAVETRARVVRSDNGVLGLAFEELERQTALAVRAHCRVSGMHQTAAVVV